MFKYLLFVQERENIVKKIKFTFYRQQFSNLFPSKSLYGNKTRSNTIRKLSRVSGHSSITQMDDKSRALLELPPLYFLPERKSPRQLYDGFSKIPARDFTIYPGIARSVNVARPLRNFTTRVYVRPPPRLILLRRVA